MKKMFQTICCAVLLSSAPHLNTAPSEHKQNMNKVRKAITSINQKIDAATQHRDRLTAYYNQLRQRYRSEK